jgi:hypothetical protein
VRARGYDFGAKDWFAKIGRVEEERLAGVDFAGGLDERAPKVFREVGGGNLFGEEDFDLAGGLGGGGLSSEASAGSKETRGKDAGVVEDEKVAEAENVREICKPLVAEAARSTIEYKHSAGATGGGRVLGNEVFGEVEVEVGDAHGS